MSRTRAKRPVRSPFVVTLAAAAAILAPACGGRVDPSDPGTDTGSDTGTDSQPIDCPTSAPMHGAACTGTSSCGYGDCGGAPTTTAECVKGQWQVMSLSCNPPPPECPNGEPTVGTPCVHYGSGCSYADRCVPSAQNHYTCVGGRWEGSGPPEPPVACPTTPPLDGASCADCAGRYPETCVYEWCGAYPSREAICNPVTKTWSSRWASCNPPPPDAGPADAPWSEDSGFVPEPDLP